MNFDFLKDLSGLSYVYENCINAEKLAMTMPVQSVMTSRKSAELLAKFIYMTAHRQEIGRLTFENILFDTTVKKYINNSKVMDAFHYIRMSGNEATHAEVQESTKEAINVLKDLHYVAGEIARRVGLIDDYPDFDHEIDSFSDAKYIEEQDIEKKVSEMFADYVMKYYKEIEINNNFTNFVTKLQAKFEGDTSGYYLITREIVQNETLEFKSKPVHQSSVKRIQAHFGFRGMLALDKLRGKLHEDTYVDYSSELTIYGKDGYTTTDLEEFLYGIFHDLPNADGFKIKSSYIGPLLLPDFNEPPFEEFQHTVEDMGESENFTYKFYEFLPSSGESWCKKYENGRRIDLEEQFSEDIVDKDFGQDWWCENFLLGTYFDYEKHPDILEKLHETIRKYIPEYELKNCEENWENGYNEEDGYSDEVGILCPYVSWGFKTLREVQYFLDEVNHILEPIKHEVNAVSDGKWYISDPPSAVATCVWTEDGFKMVGTEF